MSFHHRGATTNQDIRASVHDEHEVQKLAAADQIVVMSHASPGNSQCQSWGCLNEWDTHDCHCAKCGDAIRFASHDVRYNFKRDVSQDDDLVLCLLCREKAMEMIHQLVADWCCKK